MNQAYLHRENMEDIRERLENSVTQSSVETMYDGEDCFITVTQRNETTGNESKWSFCVDFGTNKVQMLEPTEDEESFSSDNEVFRIIKNFLNGGMSREKRMNRPDYDYGEPIKITGRGNKIGSSRRPIKSSSNPSIMIYIRNPETGKWASQAWCDKYQKDPYYYDRAEIIDNPAGYSDKERVIYWSDDINDAICFSTPERARNYPLKGKLYTAEDVPLFGVKLDTIQPLNNSRKPIKSSWFKPEDIIAYLVGGDEDTITVADEDEAVAYNVYYYGYGIMDDGEKGHMFIGKYSDVKEFVGNYLGLGWTDEFAYPYILSGTEITKYFQNLPSKPLPTEKDYQDFVNQLNKYVDKEYGREFGTGSIYHFNMYKGEGTNSDGYGHEYPNLIIYDDEGNLDMHSDDDITEYIRNELKAKGWYPEAVHSSSDFTIAVI